MYRFYINESSIHTKQIHVMGSDVNHIKNVLRMKVGDSLILCDGKGNDYYSVISVITEYEVIAFINKVVEADSELSVRVYLFQGLPKKDKMELIIQKAVELGVYEIIPMVTKRTIVKLDDKKKELKKLERWQTIAESAAKQSGRGVIPLVREVVSFRDALMIAKDLYAVMIPYEMTDNMEKTRAFIRSVKNRSTLGIFIGPEGGFEEKEVKEALELEFIPVTLGKRILRTETAAMVALSFLAYELED